MSFDRLSSLEAQPTTSRSTGYTDSPEFGNLTTTLSQRLFTLTSNLTQLNRQLALIGTKKDSEIVRNRVQKLLNETRDAFKSVGEGVKRVQHWPEDLSPSQKYTQEKLQNQFASTLADFQSAQRLSAEKTREFVDAARRKQRDRTSGEFAPYTDEEPSGSSSQQQQQEQQQQQQQAALADQAEVDFQESMIIQREEEIRGIEHGITEINDIFRDLGTMVSQQENTLDLINVNVSQAAQDHKQASQELRSAARYQKGARNKACCLLLILAIVLTVVLLAVIMG